MTKKEAKQAMSEGKKVTHKYFTATEWVTSNEYGKVLLEDGIILSWLEFWNNRVVSIFDDGWELYKEDCPYCCGVGTYYDYDDETCTHTVCCPCAFCKGTGTI